MRPRQTRPRLLQAMIDAFRLPDLRRRILFTFGVLVVFRFIAHVPLPGVNADALQVLFEQNALLGMMECLVLGWMYRISRLRHHANERSDWKLGPWWDWVIRVVAPVILSALFIWSIFEQATAPELCVGPFMQAASSWTTPRSLGRPPRPTLESSGSASTVLTTSIATSSSGRRWPTACYN